MLACNAAIYVPGAFMGPDFEVSYGQTWLRMSDLLLLFDQRDDMPCSNRRRQQCELLDGSLMSETLLQGAYGCKVAAMLQMEHIALDADASAVVDTDSGVLLSTTPEIEEHEASRSVELDSRELCSTVAEDTGRGTAVTAPETQPSPCIQPSVKVGASTARALDGCDRTTPVHDDAFDDQGGACSVAAAEEAAEDAAPSSPAKATDTNKALAADELSPHERYVFFAKVPPCVPASEIAALFTRCGKVLGVNLFKPWATSKTSKVRT
jgi:hypothetical protein